MSAMMIILLSSLTLFGAILIDPVGEEPETEPDVPEADPVAPGEDANNPRDEAVQETPSDETDTEADTETETETVDDSSEETEDAAESDEESGVEVIDETDTGNQSIFGSLQSDTIDGEAGDDTIDGRLGDDTIEGGLGADQISGGAGADVLFGGTINSQDDGAADTLLGGEGDDRLNLENTDVATGGAGADTFVRLATMSERSLVTDFDTSEDVVVVSHQSDEPPTLERQTIATDGVILELSDGSRIELAGLTEAVDASLISFVDTRAP
jgi:hypothetical protein